MIKWFRKLRKRHIWYVIVVGFWDGAAKNPHHVGPFYNRASAKRYREQWDKQFKGFAVLDKRPFSEPVADVLAMKWKVS